MDSCQQQELRFTESREAHPEQLHPELSPLRSLLDSERQWHGNCSGGNEAKLKTVVPLPLAVKRLR